LGYMDIGDKFLTADATYTTRAACAPSLETTILFSIALSTCSLHKLTMVNTFAATTTELTTSGNVVARAQYDMPAIMKNPTIPRV
jgi:hypothetical protein